MVLEYYLTAHNVSIEVLRRLQSYAKSCVERWKYKNSSEASNFSFN